MIRLRTYFGVAVLVAIVAALGISSVASAQVGTSAAPAARFAHGGGFGRGMCGQAGLDAIAKALDMTSEELSAQLWGGRTLADLADKAGVDLLSLQTAMQTACTEATKAAIEQAVEDGSLTREHADWLLEGIEKGYWGGGMHGFGFGGRGFGRGGFHGGAGFRGFGFPNSNSVTPGSSGL
ncbi:MAG TPA: hypothetical protein VJ754_08225 [Anaerolineae bacterium]|nr:hypothetical protein [Anaerolineae bacterium]